MPPTTLRGPSMHASEERAGADPTLGLILEQTRRFARGLDAAAMDRDGCMPPSVRSRAAEVGLFGLTVPSSDGGLGLSLGDACQVVAELACADRSVATMVGLHAGLGTRGIVELAPGPVRERWLPRMASGDVVGAFCATEPGAGSDLTAIRTEARLEGDVLVLTGDKAYVTNGGFAGAFTVLARTPGMGGARGWSLLLVPRDADGVEVGREEHKLGIRASSTTSVSFDRVRLPLEHVLGTAGGGMAHAHRLLEWGRTVMAAGCVGTARAALERTLDHVRGRRQFGRPLGQLEVCRSQVAAMASELAAMEAAVVHVGRMEAAGEPIGMASAALKVLCSEGAFQICDRALQLHGALGFVEDTGVALLGRDCRVTRIFEGANDVLLVRLGTAIASRASGVERRLHHASGMEDAQEAWDAANLRLEDRLRELRSERGIRLVQDQLLLHALGQAHVGLFAASAAMGGRGGDGLDALARRHAVHRFVERAERALDGAARAGSERARVGALADALQVGGEDDGPQGPRVRREARATERTAGRAR